MTPQSGPSRAAASGVRHEKAASFEWVKAPAGAARLIHELLNEFFSCLGQNVDIRANLGIAEFPLQAADGNALIRNASVALNVAEQNKQEHVVFDPETRSVAKSSSIKEIKYIQIILFLTLSETPKVCTQVIAEVDKMILLQLCASPRCPGVVVGTGNNALLC